MISVAVVNPVFTSITEIGKILPNRRALEDKNAKRMKAKKYRPMRYKKDVSVVFTKIEQKTLNPESFHHSLIFYIATAAMLVFISLLSRIRKDWNIRN